MKMSRLIMCIFVASSLYGCGKDAAVDQPTAPGKSDPEAALSDVCSSMPDTPLCNRDPKPGFAKFAVGSASAVRWTGKDQCYQLDLKTGRQGDERLTVAEGEVKSFCHDDDVHFEFIYQKHKKALTADAWTSAFRPLSVNAAHSLLSSCRSNSAPDPSQVIGKWWKANNTYAENQILRYISPLGYATDLLPFDDDGIERIGEEVVNNVKTIKFSNDVATVWMYANIGKNRPLRVIDSEGNTDMYFTEWEEPFTVKIPDDMRSLSEICTTD